MEYVTIFKEPGPVFEKVEQMVKDSIAKIECLKVIKPDVDYVRIVVLRKNEDQEMLNGTFDVKHEEQEYRCATAFIMGACITHFNIRIDVIIYQLPKKIKIKINDELTKELKDCNMDDYAVVQLDGQ